MSIFSGLTKVQPYAVIALDVSGIIADQAQGAVTVEGVSVADWIANSITILSAGGATMTFRLDDVAADKIQPVSDGLKVEGIPFTDIYWTVTAGGTIAYALIAWVD